MKTIVVGHTTFLEIIRRPLFWLVFLCAAMLLVSYNFVPYFTQGEDIKMVKDQGLATILVAGLIISLFSASVSIADEIEGKTAITLLSKPISRLSFILGKYLGIMMAIFLLFLLLSLVFWGALCHKVGYDAYEQKSEPPTVMQRIQEAFSMNQGIVLAYLEVAVLCAISVAFSTRFPLFLNITAIITIFMLGNLAPMMVQVAESDTRFKPVEFMAKIFSTVLPYLPFFNVAAAISTETYVPWTYVAMAFVYAVLYAAIALFVALLMFEDRDLA